MSEQTTTATQPVEENTIGQPQRQERSNMPASSYPAPYPDSRPNGTISPQMGAGGCGCGAGGMMQNPGNMGTRVCSQ